MRPNTTPEKINVPKVSTHLHASLSEGYTLWTCMLAKFAIHPPPYTLSVLRHKAVSKTLVFPLAVFMLAHPLSCTEDSVAGYFRCSGISALLGPLFRALCAITGVTDKTGQDLYA